MLSGNRIVIVFLLLFCAKQSQANDFPSLLVANATMGVILDHDYLGEEYESTFELMKQVIERVIREDLKVGGLQVKYYSWSRINFNKDFTAIFSVANCKNTWETFHHVRRERLLLIAFTEPDCPRLPLHEALTIPRMKIGAELPQIILDIRAARAVNWKTATVLYDDIFDRDIISRVANALSAESSALAMSFSLLKLNASSDIYERRENIKKSLNSFPNKYVGRNYLVIATIPTTIIEVATEMNLIDSMNQWMFLISNPKKTNVSTLIPYIKEGGNVAIATNNTATDSGGCASGEECLFHELLKNFVIALSKLVREEEAIYGQISDEEWEAIRLTKRERRDSMLEHIKQSLRDNQICTPCIKWKFEAAETWGLRFEVLQTGGKIKPFKAITTKAATWEPTNGLIVYDALFPHITYGFRNRTIPIATFHNPPWQIVTYSDSGEVTRLRGIVINILDEMASKLNFTYFVYNVERSSNRTGYSYLDDFNVTSEDDVKSTFTFPGDILELLTDNKVVFGATALTVNEYYEKVVNFTYPISVQPYAMLIPRPKELSRLYLFAAPFTIDTWLCLSVTIALIGPLLYAINYVTPFNEHHHIEKKGGLFRIQNCFWYIYGALLQQGGMYLPRSDSGRIIIGTWWLVVLVVVTTYCGNLVAFLTFPQMESPINTVHQLVTNKKSFQWGIRANTYLESFLRETDIEKYILLNESAELHEMASSAVVDRVRNGKYVYIDWYVNLMNILLRDYAEIERCDLTMGVEKFLEEKIGLVVPANSPYLAIFDNEIYRMLQMGFIQKWLDEFLPKKGRCSSVAGSMEFENHTVNLIDMQGCFLVLIAGIIGSIIIVIFECICHKKRFFTEKRIIKPFVK